MSTGAEGYRMSGQFAQPAHDEEDHRTQAARLDRDNPRWLVVWGTFSHQFVAFPLFEVPGGTVLCCRTGPELVRRMQQAEEIYGRGPRCSTTI
jgi:hypothetical protein